jgi:hypothetical protein
LLLSLGLAIFNIIIKELIISSTIRDSQIAFSAADAGAECALYWDLEHPGLDNGAFGGPSLGELNQGLVGHWKLDEGAGTTAEDSSGNGNTATVSGAQWTSGKVGGGLDFDPSHEVAAGDNGSLDLEVYTYSFWIYPQAAPTGNWRQVLIKGNGPVNSGRSPGVWLRPNDMGLHIMHSTSNGSQNGINATSEIVVNNWTHVAFTSTGDGGIIQSYINGVSDAGQDITSGTDLIANDQSFTMGRGSVTADMVLDEVRIDNRALDADEINSLYNLSATETFDPPVDPGETVFCGGENITTRVWNTGETNTAARYAKTVFEMIFPNGTNAMVTVEKDDSATKIDSRGYNTSDPDNPRRVERGLRVTY